jgi:hypothetical protein
MRSSAVAAIFLIAYGFILRLSYWGTQYHPDSYRDYLIGHLTVRDGRLPLEGPWSGFLGTTSTIYYALLSSILRIHDSLPFLNLVNILLQLVPAAAVFLIARRLFSNKTALVALFLYSANRILLQLSFYFWAPSLMEPIFWASCLLLTEAYFRKNSILLLFAIIFFMVAGAVYSPALAFAPFFFLCLVLTLKRIGGVKLYVGALGTLVGTIYILRLPILAIATHQASAPTYIQNLTRTLTLLWNIQPTYMAVALDGASGAISIARTLIALLAVAGIFAYVYVAAVPTQKKRVILLVLSSIVLFLLSAAIVPTDLKYRHMTLLFGPLSIVLAQIIATIFRGKPIRKVAGIAVTIALGYFFAMQPADFVLARRKALYDPFRAPISSMISTIQKIQNEESYPTPTFFRIAFNPDSPDATGYDSAFWMYLEEELVTPLVVLDDSVPYTRYRTTNTDEYMFIICDSIYGGKDFDSCAIRYMAANPMYRYVETLPVSDRLFVVLAKRKILTFQP